MRVMRVERVVRGALVIVLLAILPARSAAQASIVPATHPVYDWLLEQRVAGNLPDYEYEVRPMSRATIVAHLETLEQLGDRLSPANRLLLTDFLNEFDMRRLAANRGWTVAFFRGLPRSVVDAVRKRRDPVLWAGFNGDSSLSGAIYRSTGGGSLQLKEIGANDRRYVSLNGARAFLNTSWGLGYHIDVDNINGSGSHDLIAHTPRYNNEALKPDQNASYAYETYLSYRARKYFEIYMGRGAQVLGPAVTDALILRADAPYLSSLRMQIGTPRLNYTYLHAQLYASPSLDTLRYEGAPILAKIAPTRYFVAHRVTWRPISNLTLSIQEALIYANRGLSLNYLVPVVPLTFFQAGDGDQDNLMAGADIVYRPWRGTELLGSLVEDDASLSFGRIQKRIMLVGIEQYVLPTLRLGASYTSSDPWVYTHWLRLNTWESHGQPLGAELGPNGEEWAARLTSWLPLRTRVMVGYRYIRKGLNPIDMNGNETDVGGDLMIGKASTFQERYLGADVNDVKRREIEAETEIIRGFNISVRMRDDVTVKGTRIPSARFIDFRMRFGF